MEGTGACVLVGGAGFCLSAGHVVSGGVFWGVLIMILGSISGNGWHCVPFLLVVCHVV